MSSVVKTEEELKDDFRKSMVKLKRTAESYVVLSIYKSPELFHDADLKAEDFDNMDWKFYFAIAKKLIEQEKLVLDDIVVGLCVSENEALQKMYDEHGGWETIQNGKNFIQIENFDGYVQELKKYNALIRLHDFGYPIMKQFDTYKTMSVEAIQETLEGALASIFADVTVDEKVEDMSEGLWQVVLDADAGKMRGFPYTSALLNDYVNGQALGNLTMVSANSGMGKTFFSISQVLPNMIEFKEKLLILANEEDKQKWQREIITWVVNNIIEEGDFNKKRFNQGEFNKDEFALLKKATDWLNDKMEKGIIKFVNFQSFKMSKAIKLIKKYSSVFGFKYFILDTLKLDSDAVSADGQAWLQLMQGMTKLYDLCKPSNRNVHCYVTYQLGKSAMMTRYLSQNSLGVSKNVVDTVSTLILFRHALESEKEGGRNEVTVKTKKGNKKMQKDKQYFIVFLGKNRMGETHRQLVFEVDMSRNRIIEFGTCLIEQDI